MFFCFFPVSAQRVELDFPKLSGDSAWLYVFSGSRVDSTWILLDEKGQGVYLTPAPSPKERGDFPPSGELKGAYRGMAYLYIPGKGGGEVIIAEEQVQVGCAEEQFHGGMLEFSNSTENCPDG